MPMINNWVCYVSAKVNISYFLILFHMGTLFTSVHVNITSYVIKTAYLHQVHYSFALKAHKLIPEDRLFWSLNTCKYFIYNFKFIFFALP